MPSNSKIDDSDPGSGVTIPFGRKYAGSEQFKAVFREGMALVEGAAAYLDGDGRREARGLTPAASLAYATESMRLTTRLMQLASWLLIRRAVNEGELTPEQALEEKHKVKLKAVEPVTHTAAYEQLPERLRTMIEESLRLHRRIVRLDTLIHAEAQPREPGPPAVSMQIEWLKTAFDAGDGAKEEI